MKKKLFQKVLALLLSVTTLFGVFVFSVSAASDEKVYGSNQDTAATLEEMQQLVGVLPYAEYLKANGDKYVSGLPTISVDLNNMVSGSNGVKPADSKECLDAFKNDQKAWANFGDNWDSSIYLPATGKTTWNFQIPDGAASYYYIKIVYYSCLTGESSISAVERKLFIDGQVPFNEASNIKLDKYWQYTNYTVEESETDEADFSDTKYELRDDGYYKIVTNVKNGKKTVKTYVISQDINGNSMLPQSEQLATWNTSYVQDDTGYYSGYLRFYLLNGSHQLTFAAEREPVIIKSIELVPYDPKAEGNTIPTYAEVKKEYADKGYTSASGAVTTIETEFPDYVSDSSVYATNDASSNATYPSSSKSQLYNVIGKNSYDTVGQWSAYKFTVNETGLYKLSMRYKQSTLQGMYVCRAFMLSGGAYGLEDGTPALPFAEANNAQFNYSKEWQSTFISDAEGNVFEFYFEKGVEYTLYVECSLGSLRELVQRVENSLVTLNDAYLRILQLTGASPDDFRDYAFVDIMPDVLRTLGLQAIELDSIKTTLEELCGTNGAHIATLETVALLLDTMSRDDGFNIAANMANFKAYLGTLGTWVNDTKKGVLVMDKIGVVPADMTDKELKKLMPTESGFFKSLWFEITSFFNSFFTDYDNMGLTEMPDENSTSIDVWIATGRDQSQIWRTMIDAQGGFTDLTGIAVKLKLVVGGTLLPSILSGKGPDVYLGLSSTDTINYAIRDAVIGMSGNDTHLDDETNAIFNNTYYTYKDENGKYEITTEYRGEENLTFVSDTFEKCVNDNYISAAMEEITPFGVSYGIPETMTFSVLFYRMDVLAELGTKVPETWGDLLSILPALQANNMGIGIGYATALNYMLYQQGGNMWKYVDNPEYAGSEIALDTDIAIESFEFVCKLYTDYGFDIAFDGSNRFRTGEMPLMIGDYCGTYNTLTVYATEIDGLWKFCPLPGTRQADGTINYNSIEEITASVIVNSCDEVLASWQFMQWQTSPEIQANYGNKMVALIGPSAKYATANINAIRNLSWTAEELVVIEDQIKHMSAVVSYPGSYIISRYTKFAFLDAVAGKDAVDAISEYIDTINAEITRKREEFGLKTGAPDGWLE